MDFGSCSAMIAAGMTIAKERALKPMPIVIFHDVLGPSPTPLRTRQTAEKSGASAMMYIALSDCHQLEGNALPKAKLLVYLSAKRVRLEPACSNAAQNSMTNTARTYKALTRP